MNDDQRGHEIPDWQCGTCDHADPEYEPAASVYVVFRDPSHPFDSMMVFSDEAEAQTYADYCGGEMADGEPVFDTADHCIEWCGQEPREETA